MITQQERLAFCKVCNNRKIDPNKGLICGVTMTSPAFEETCEDYNADPFELSQTKIDNGSFGTEVDGVIPVTASVRLANFIIDRIVMIGLTAVIALLMYDANIGVEFLENDSRLNDYIFGSILAFVYYSIMEMATNRSVGKYITGTVVVLEDGSKPEFPDILSRTFVRIIPFDPFSYIGSGIGWHDKWSKTRVVKKSSLKHFETNNSEILDDFN